MTLQEAIDFLEVNSHVSCPQITCEQAAEVAGLMWGLHAQHQVDVAEMVSWKIHAQAIYERDSALKQVELLEAEIAALKRRAVVEAAPDFDADDYARPWK